MHMSMLLLLLATSTDATAEITWLQLDWPPHQIVTGPFAGEGTYDLLAKQFIVGLPQFKHQIRLTNLQRMEQAFVQGEPGICTMVGTLYSAERAQNRLFSSVVIVGSRLVVGYVGHQLAQHPALESGSVDIVKLASDPAYNGAYQPDRHYPELVQTAITMQDSNLIAHNLTSEVNAVALLKSGRVQYVLEYPERFNYFNQLLAQPELIEYKGILGAVDKVDSYIACSKDSVGQAAIDAINQLLPKLWRDDTYLKAMRRWLDDTSWQQLRRDIQLEQSSQEPETGQK
jgi:uncharacterized protein (TIGR02285 family)